MFGSLPPGTVEFILASSDLLSEILLYHVLGTQVFSDDLTNGASVATVGGSSVAVSIDNQDLRINEARVTSADNLALNGVVHVIDSVLVPPNFMVPQDIVATALLSDMFDSFVAALQVVDLLDEYSFPNGPFTVCKSP